MLSLRLLVLFAGVMFAAGWMAAAEGKKEAEKPKEGQPAPDVKLPATQIESVLPDKKGAKELSLKDLKGKNVVLFFYPKAMTKGCTIESCGFRDLVKEKEFEKLNTVILGISIDKLEDQVKFTDKEKLNFPLLADTDKKVATAFGIPLRDNGMTQRYTVIIDKSGTIRKIVAPPDTDPNKHPKEVLSYIKDNLAK